MKRIFHTLLISVLVTSLFSVTTSASAAPMLPTCTPDLFRDGAGKTVVKFVNTTACTWSIPDGVTAISKILMVGGGGGGGGASLGNNSGTTSLKRGAPGGGGGGGYVWSRTTETSVPTDRKITVTAGSAGSGSAAVIATGQYQTSPGTSGGTTTIVITDTYTAPGGGGGGVGTAQCLSAPSASCSGDGGLSGNIVNGSQTNTTVGLNAYDAAGGGAGAGGNGSDGVDAPNLGGSGGNGGSGFTSDITGSNVIYGGGGGGGMTSTTTGNSLTGGSGGSGGGGEGQSRIAGNNRDAISYGGGGGGGGHSNALTYASAGGNGFSGVVYISYVTPTLPTPSAPTLSVVTGSSTSLTAAFTADPNAATYTAKVYLASDGITQIGSDIEDFQSGDTISGLEAGTEYKVQLLAIGDGIYFTDSAPSALSSPLAPPRSAEAGLTFVISPGTVSAPVTALDTTTIKVSVSETVSSINFTPTASANASITFCCNASIRTYTSISSGSLRNETLVSGLNTFNFKVTAQNGTTIKNYTVLVTKAVVVTKSVATPQPRPSATPTPTPTFKVAATRAPRITGSPSPASAAIGAQITLTGSGFTGTKSVKLGTVNAPIFTVVSDTQIRFTIPVGAVTSSATVTNSAGSATSGRITVTP
ncbi:MAG: hypothetical protein F2690_00685 [Actinobacteria bacterium]|uniref:Unannotated protein n=1 Tax=freshwater metagenome TaxID=449393 RepID=A0A6J7VYU2_9ZZZZ|nr:hypothetical protein [Actinomycetota bacterium]MSX71571.1 hypothetical protein [Actinomycetota bacterium]MSY69075.1 hypothetical protein [Actinomycetota bacterium]MTA75516.1 hypothetical protein [Actinomycetota bacterium]